MGKIDQMPEVVDLKTKTPEKVYTAEEQAIIDKTSDLINKITPMITEEAMTSMEPAVFKRVASWLLDKKVLIVGIIGLVGGPALAIQQSIEKMGDPTSSGGLAAGVILTGLSAFIAFVAHPNRNL